MSLRCLLLPHLFFDEQEPRLVQLYYTTSFYRLNPIFPDRSLAFMVEVFKTIFDDNQDERLNKRLIRQNVYMEFDMDPVPIV
jgi:hypothetical protein